MRKAGISGSTKRSAPKTDSVGPRKKKQANAEVDFIIVQDAKVIPVEVKSCSSGTLRSLHSLIDESGIDYALRLYSGPKSIEKNETPKGRKPYTLMNLPLYYAGRLIQKMG